MKEGGTYIKVTKGVHKNNKGYIESFYKGLARCFIYDDKGVGKRVSLSNDIFEIIYPRAIPKGRCARS